MNLSVNGQSQVPPGFRFHPTEEELLHYYLRKKVAYEKIDLDVIRDVDLNKLEPWDIQEKCRIGSTPQNDWYFFSHKDKKYPTGTRTNRATAAGFWKATGRDKVIHSNCRRIGMRKTLVFYRGRAPHGQKSDWIMHEYRLDDNLIHDSTINASNNICGDSGPEEGWVVCRVFKKKNYHKALDSPQLPSSTSSLMSRPYPRNDGVLDHLLTYMGRSSPSTFKQEDQIPNRNENNPVQFPNHVSTGFIHLPSLESPTINPSSTSLHSNNIINEDPGFKYPVLHEIRPLSSSEPADWVALDRLVASQLNGGQPSSDKTYISGYGETSMMMNEDFSFSFDQDELPNMDNSDVQRTNDEQRISSSDNDFWCFARSSSSSSSDPLCHLSV